ncbi:hypothetical protein OEZ85_012778 [Tetradesmus obliquus]|uniref:Uncharacterized protein n=1 Tax=Tetradesmus obliquus TaxID=3088 RepID=A0ABY8U3V7_TETOB|nr:hypothetical protein OEZ85_012778 [Tetradesmus obliquus]
MACTPTLVPAPHSVPGIAKGPQAVEESLSSILDSNVLLVADRVRQLQDQQGLSEVLAELERAHLEYHRSEHRPMLYAASEASQRVYCLVEGRYQDVGALPGHPATFRISKVHHILALQMGPSGSVARLWLRRQMTEEDKDELLHEPLACYASPFPRDSLRLADAITHEAAGGQMINAIKFWWQAWSSAHTSSSSSSSSHGASSTPAEQLPAEPSSTTPADPAAAAAAAAAGQPPAAKPRTLRRADPAIAAGKADATLAGAVCQ